MSSTSVDTKIIWVVVEVWRGLPVAVDHFQEWEDAHDFLMKLRDRINENTDEADIFELKIPCTPLTHKS